MRRTLLLLTVLTIASAAQFRTVVTRSCCVAILGSVREDATTSEMLALAKRLMQPYSALRLSVANIGKSRPKADAFYGWGGALHVFTSSREWYSAELGSGEDYTFAQVFVFRDSAAYRITRGLMAPPEERVLQGSNPTLSQRRISEAVSSVP